MVQKHPEEGHITLQSASQRGLYLGMKPDGRVWSTVDTGVKNICLFPEVIECESLFTVTKMFFISLINFMKNNYKKRLKILKW
jgi:hypothetical protein